MEEKKRPILNQLVILGKEQVIIRGRICVADKEIKFPIWKHYEDGTVLVDIELFLFTAIPFQTLMLAGWGHDGFWTPWGYGEFAYAYKQIVTLRHFFDESIVRGFDLSYEQSFFSSCVANDEYEPSAMNLWTMDSFQDHLAENVKFCWRKERPLWISRKPALIYQETSSQTKGYTEAKEIPLSNLFLLQHLNRMHSLLTAEKAKYEEKEHKAGASLSYIAMVRLGALIFQQNKKLGKMANSLRI